MTLFFNILFSPNKQNVVGALLYVFLFIFIFVEHHYYRKKKLININIIDSIRTLFKHIFNSTVEIPTLTYQTYCAKRKV